MPAAALPSHDPGLPGGPTGSREQTIALWLWVLDFVLAIVAPWALWRLKRRTSRFVDFHGKACLNHTATVLVLILAACAVLGGLGKLADWADQPWTTIGIVCVLGLVILALGVFTFVVHVIAAFKAAAGVWYTPPLCWKFVK
jgi:uncharacterized Tic20 family protein